jgi:hypothetical protein
LCVLQWGRRRFTLPAIAIIFRRLRSTTSRYTSMAGERILAVSTSAYFESMVLAMNKRRDTDFASGNSTCYGLGVTLSVKSYPRQSGFSAPCCSKRFFVG